MRSVPEWIGKTDDSPIPDRVKDRVAKKAGDCCQQCSRKIGSLGLRAEFDHVVAIGIGGQNRESNIRLLCHECHGTKTNLDKKLIAKSRRIRKRHLGIKSRKGRPIPGSRGSGIRKPMNAPAYRDPNW